MESQSLTGQTISHYRIVEKLGGGGMGVVYKAQDLRLQRCVALKFLPDYLKHDHQALERLRREALAASALNHPNICTLHDIDEYSGQPFLVMELIEGDTLCGYSRGKPLPVDEALNFGIQIADALEAAHAKSIIHRDIKPSNVFVTGRGQIKVLDFGLAKLAPVVNEGALSEQERVWHRGMEDPISAVGIISGTPSYMSPEQVRGDDLDARSDIFSLGTVLYEMATAQKAFSGATPGRTIEAILSQEPLPLREFNAEIPAELESIIRRSLRKEPSHRYQNASEVRRDLQRLKQTLELRRIAGSGAEPAAVIPGASAAEIEPPGPELVGLPAMQTLFVGREKEAAELQNLLKREGVRLVTVTGPGGIGKTRLAVEVARNLAKTFPNGIYFAPLALLRDSALIPPVIAQAIGIREGRDQSPLEALKKHLQDPRNDRMLVLLDNFEHVMKAAPLVSELLSASAHCKIVVTSRAPLHVYGEQEFPVPPLGLPSASVTTLPTSLARYPAITLFVKRAVAAKPDFQLTAENAAAVADICARLDGLPLAIELAAARIKVLSPASLLTRLSRRLQLLTGGALDLPQRQQTLRSAMDWSYELLSAEEQKLFRRLAVFAGGCDLEGVEAVCDTKSDLGLDLLDGMASMVDKSLIQQVARPQGESRFAMLETIREYAMEKLEGSGEKAATKRTHAAYCLVLAEEQAADSGIGEKEWLERCAVEHDNFRVALDWLIDSRDAEWAVRLATALFRFWETREFFSEGRERLSRVLALEPGKAPSRVRMRALFAAGILAGDQGDYTTADSLIRESEKIARELEDRTGVAISLNALAVHARDRLAFDAAHTLFEQSLAIWQEMGDQKATARAISNLASVAKLRGDYVLSRKLYEECISIFKEVCDQTGVAWSLNHEGDVAQEQNSPDDARKLYERALAIFRERNDRWGIASALADLGNLSRGQGNNREAQALYAESIAIFQELEHKRGVARLLECFASLSVQRDAARSIRLAGAAATLRERIGAPLTATEQTRFEASLDPARRVLKRADSSAAWSEGRTMALEKAIEEALLAEQTPS